jgi:hypothetical protein
MMLRSEKKKKEEDDGEKMNFIERKRIERTIRGVRETKKGRKN